MNIIIPGLRNSDENHWQSFFERSNPKEFMRVIQDNWDEPDCETWIERIEETLSDMNHEDLVLIGHSIGCMAIVRWYEKYEHKIKGTLLVAPSDAERENYPSYITGFAPLPMMKLPFPSILVASTNDHVTSFDRSKEFAENWGSELVVLEDAGHIEPKSGFSEWKEGLNFVEQLGA